jgi:hypothetical protein
VVRDSSVAAPEDSAEPDEAANAALIVLDGATQVRRDPGVYGSFHVAYGLKENHPASEAIQQITSRLTSLGWKPLKTDWSNPELESSHIRGWTDFRDATVTPVRHVHQWMAQWKDESGCIVDYGLTYSYPESGPQDLQSLWVNAGWYPAEGVKAMEATMEAIRAEQ